MKQHEFRQITLKLEAQRKSRIRACTSTGLLAGDKAGDSDIPEICIRRQSPNGKLRNNFKIHVPEKDFSLKSNALLSLKSVIWSTNFLYMEHWNLVTVLLTIPATNLRQVNATETFKSCFSVSQITVLIRDLKFSRRCWWRLLCYAVLTGEE